MTDFLHDEEIYRLSDPKVQALQDKIEGIDTIILLDKELSDLPDTVGEALNKMLAVVGKQNTSACLVPDKGLSFRNVQRKWSPKYVLAFGFSPKMLDLNIAAKRNQIIQFEGEKLLFCEGIELMTDASKKKALWQNLQVLFELT